MHERILRQMREKIRRRQYVVTLHAEEEMNEDDLSVFDVERIILTGEIIERQEDAHSGEWKYLILGHSIIALPVTVVVKLSITGKMVIITVFQEQ